MKKFAAMAFAVSLLAASAEEIRVSPGVNEVLKLSKSQISPEVIKEYVDKSPLAFDLTADEIIHLHKSGVSDDVVATMLKHVGEMRRAAAAGTAIASAAPTPAQTSVVAQPDPRVVATPGYPAVPVTAPAAPIYTYADATPVYAATPSYYYSSYYSYPAYYTWPSSFYFSLGYPGFRCGPGFRSSWACGSFPQHHVGTRFAGNFSGNRGFAGHSFAGRPTGNFGGRGFAQAHPGGGMAGRRR